MSVTNKDVEEGTNALSVAEKTFQYIQIAIKDVTNLAKESEESSILLN